MKALKYYSALVLIVFTALFGSPVFAVMEVGFGGGSVRSHASTPKSGYLSREFPESSLFNAGLARAQVPSGVELENVAALVAFGEQITFVATLKSSRPIQVASILILDEARGTTHVEPLVVHGNGRTQYRYATSSAPRRLRDRLEPAE